MATVRTVVGDHPMGIAATLAAGFLAYAAVRVYAPLPPGTWPGMKDAVIFEYGGRYLARGNRLYIDLWALKPPLPFELAAVLALVAGESVVRFHVLAVLATCAAVVLTAAAIAGIVDELTGDAVGAIVGGVATFALPYYFYRPLVGFKAKYFVIAAGLWCLYLAYRGRPLGSGVAGAVAVGFWQLAVIFPFCAIGLLWQSNGRSAAIRFVAAGCLTAGAILLPVVLWGALREMVAEVVLTPLLVTEGRTPVARLRYLARLVRTSLPIVFLGLVGFGRGAFTGRLRRQWPLVVAVGWFTVQLLVLDLDNAPDLFPWLAILAVGTGLAVASGPVTTDAETTAQPDGGGRFLRGRRAVVAGMLALAVISVATMGGFGVVESGLLDQPTYDTKTGLDPDMDGARTYNATERQYVFWHDVAIPNCRAFGGHTQYALVTRAGLAGDRSWYEAACGQFDPLWRAVWEAYGF